MAEPSFVCLYLDYRSTFEPFSDEERGRLVTAMLEFAATGAVPEFQGNERFAWPQLQGQIERDRKKYFDRCEQNRIIGVKGGRPKSEPLPTPNPAAAVWADRIMNL
jgi:hypothetical protein